jgi:hypothetical protein
MSTLLDRMVPPTLRAALDRDDHEGFTMALLTVTEEAFPHQALISVGEIIVLDDTDVRLATWPSSTTTRNMARTGRCALTAVVDGVAYTVLLALVPHGELSLPGGGLTVVDGRVVEASADTAPYAVLESGIRFRLNDPATVLDRWTTTRLLLRELGPSVWSTRSTGDRFST